MSIDQEQKKLAEEKKNRRRRKRRRSRKRKESKVGTEKRSSSSSSSSSSSNVSGAQGAPQKQSVCFFVVVINNGDNHLGRRREFDQVDVRMDHSQGHDDGVCLGPARHFRTSHVRRLCFMSMCILIVGGGVSTTASAHSHCPKL